MIDSEGAATKVEVVYAGRGTKRRVIVRTAGTHESLFVAGASDCVGALRAAARALAVCDARGWVIAKIEPFPWGSEVLRGGANDGATTRRTRGGGA